MASSIHKQQGVTLVEVILVLVISMAILYFSIQQYLIYKRATDVYLLKRNINILFQAAAKYYKANCAIPNPYGIPNILSVANLPSATYYSVSYDTLVSEGYLSEPLSPSPFVQPGSDAPEGYLIQFNLAKQPNGNLIPRTVATPSGAQPVGNILFWRIQISAYLSDVAPATALQNELGADCLSSQTTDWLGHIAVAPCSLSTQGQYAVWERLPNFAEGNPAANSLFWQTMPTVMQFKQMYTTYPMSVLLAPFSGVANKQVYVCGG